MLIIIITSSKKCERRVLLPRTLSRALSKSHSHTYSHSQTLFSQRAVVVVVNAIVCERRAAFASGSVSQQQQRANERVGAAIGSDRSVRSLALCVRLRVCRAATRNPACATVCSPVPGRPLARSLANTAALCLRQWQRRGALRRTFSLTRRGSGGDRRTTRRL